MDPHTSAAVGDPGRLAAVYATGLLDSPSEEPFDRLARLARTVLGAPLAFVTVVDEHRSYWKSCIGLPDGGPRQNTVDESFCQYVVGSGEPLIAGDAATHPVTRDNPSIDLMGVAAWAGMPLRSPDGQVLGSFCVVDTEPRRWTEEQISSLAALAEAASGEIALRAALQSTSEVARTLRRVLLPPRIPVVEGLDVAAGHAAARDGYGVLGDFYDVFEASPGRWVMSIGDVRGHGPEAAETAAAVRWSVRAVARHTEDPAAVLSSVNDLVMERSGEDSPHLTAALVSFAAPAPVPGDGGAGSAAAGLDLAVTTAGHPPPLIWRAGGRIEALPASGRPLGMFEEVRLGTTGVHLDPGDSVVMFTDGATESRDASGTMLGDEGLHWALSGMGRDPSAATIVMQVLGAVRRHQRGRLRDDVAVVVLRVPEPHLGRPSAEDQR